MVSVTTARARMRGASETMRCGSSSRTPCGGSANAGFEGFAAWHVTQRRAMIACTSANATGGSPR